MTRGMGGQSPANVQQYLRDVHYPASKHEVLAQARRSDAPAHVLNAIERMVEDEFASPQAVVKGWRASESTEVMA
ncbi:hypothetical protein GCM10027066_01770 [Dyella jejuensis]